MTDLEKARSVFAAARLPFPPVPAELEAGFRAIDKWDYHSGPGLGMPYNLRACVEAACLPDRPSSLVLAHAGHGINSYAMHYYLVRGALRLLLQIGWGGVYMQHDKCAAEMLECYDTARLLIDAMARAEASGRLGGGRYLLVVGSNFYGSSWCAPGGQKLRFSTPIEALRAAFAWVDAA